MSDFKFVFNMLKQLKGNQCFSPVNISHALGMVMLGTEAETREELASVLGRGDHAQTHSVLQKALDSMKSKGPFLSKKILIFKNIQKSQMSQQNFSSSEDLK